MNWFRSPELLDRLAAEYTLGTLAGGARRRFEQVMQQRPDVARAAARWATRLLPMDARTESAPASQALWQRIEERAFGGAAAAASARQRAAGRSGGAAAAVRPGWRRWLAPVPVAALSVGVALGLGLPLLQHSLREQTAITQLPESYVGVLVTAAGQPGLIVSSLRRGNRVDLKVLQRVPVPTGHTLVLWTVDAKGVAAPVTALTLPAGSFGGLDLEQPAEAVFARAQELALSVEPVGALPAAPGGPFVYRGLCGKLWPAKPPPVR